MKETIGTRIAMIRKEKGLTQEELAERLGISAQAVSKWENDVSCPDISLFPELAKILGVTCDELLTGEAEKQDVKMVPEGERKSFDSLILRFICDVHDKDDGDDIKVRFNLPMPLVRILLETGMGIPQVSGVEALKNVDMTKLLQQVVDLAERGLMGKLMEVEVSDSVRVELFVE
ncbi:MAG: helix-turn-helix transcriptional regulator [Ruminococcus sp.]|nr:helix-turn-helix transcriptional regulator [Candidatus Apopatosoma intestinale]